MDAGTAGGLDPSSSSKPIRAQTLVVIAVVAVGLALNVLNRVNHDVAWLLHVAGQVVDGQGFYTEVVEINPPLIVWLHVPLVWISDLLSVSRIDAHPFFVLSLWSVSAAACARSWSPEGSRAGHGSRSDFLLLFAFVGLVLPFADFGQREHIMLLLVAPYLVHLSTGQARARGLSATARFFLASAAAIGLALKPHFLILWLAAEGWLLHQSGFSWKLLFRLENRVILVVLVLYASALIAWTPDYLRQVRELAAVYLRFGRLPYWASPALYVGPLALLVFGWRRYFAPAPWRRAGDLTAVALLAFLFIGMVQDKGWSYHFYPAMTSAFVLLALCAGPARPALSGGWTFVTGHWGARLVGASLFALLAVRQLDVHLDARRAQSATIYDQSRTLERVLRTESERPATVAVLTSRLQLFSGVSLAGAEWNLRVPSLWFLPPLYSQNEFPEPVIRSRAPAAMGSVEARMFNLVVEDLVGGRPDLIVLDYSLPERMSFQGRRFPYLDYYCRHPRFRDLLAEYRGEVNPGGFLMLRHVRGRATRNLRVRCPPHAVSATKSGQGHSAGNLPNRATGF